MENAIHLGDGAYATFTGYSFIITANHHLPSEATDTVHLDAGALRNLIAFAERCEARQKAESEGEPS